MPVRKDTIDKHPSGGLPSPDVSSPPCVITIEVQADRAGRRLDALLALYHLELSRSQFKKLIMDGDVLVNGHKVKPRYVALPGDKVQARLPRFEEVNSLAPEPMPLDILFEDEELIVVNKAPGIVVHPGAGHHRMTLIQGLLAHCPRLALQGAPKRPGIVHRLDQDTSGALVVAKTERAYLDLIRQFKDHAVHKEYLALVYGRFSQAGGTLRTQLGRHPKNRKKIAVVKKGREAVSHWQVMESFNEISLVKLHIETGRTHQIRVHMSHLNHPVLGDPVYGGGPRKAKAIRNNEIRRLALTAHRQMLHAFRLAFEHPRDKQPVSFEAPLPGDFAELLNELRRLSNEQQI